MNLSIIIPAYNEEKRIGRTLDGYLAFFKENIEIIIVLNGCRDRTIDQVKKRQKQFPRIIKYLNISESIGKGAAVKHGFEMASGKLIGFVDADNATSPVEFSKLIESIDGADVAIASRWKKGSEVINRSFFRKMVSLGFLILVKLLFRMPFADTQCGAKLLKKEAAEQITPLLKASNMAFDVELLYLSLKKGFRVKEIPTVWVDQSSSAMLGSPLKIFSNAIKMFFTLLRIKFKN